MSAGIIFATGNEHKIKEAGQILSGLSIPIISSKSVGIITEPDETGETFEQNALIKARAAYTCAKSAGANIPFESFIVISDDSGLEVDALDGAPGVHSARWLGEKTPYGEKNREIIRQLDGLSGAARAARFCCVIAAIFHDGKERTFKGVVEGVVADTPKGNNGFGYDPIFVVPEFGLTAAQLPPEKKNSISHRGRALSALKAYLEQIQAVSRL